MSGQGFRGSFAVRILAALVFGSAPKLGPCPATDVDDRDPVAVDGQPSRCGPLVPTE